MTETEPRSVSRRAVIATTAWTVPAIALAAPAPVFAASPCTPVPFPTGWVAASPASGTLTTGNGTNGYTTTYAAGGVNVYLSVADNTSTAAPSGTNDATVTLTRDLTLQAGRTYTFVFTIASQHAGNNAATSQLQKLDVQFNGVSIGRYTTETDATLASGYTTLATPATGIGTQSVTLTYTPTVTAVTLRYLWTIPAKNGNSGNGDIAISAPTISGC